MTSNNPVYLKIWSELLEFLVKPALREDLYRSDPTRGLTPRLRNDRGNDRDLYPFIYDRIIGALETYCVETLLPSLINVKGVQLIYKAHYCCLKDIQLKASKIWYPVLPLESRYLEKNKAQRRFAPLEERAGATFRKAIYYKIAGSLRQAAYECISDDFTIRNKGALNNYVGLLHYIRSSDKTFVDEEWNLFAYSMLSKKLYYSFLKERKPLQEFLKCAENIITSSRAIFQLSTREYMRSIEVLVSETRDERIFGNDAEEFKMIVEKGDGMLLKQLLRASKNDKEFPRRVAHQVSRLFSEFVKGKNQIRDRDWHSAESIFHRLFLMWTRLQNILKEEDKNEQAIHDSLIVPFLNEVNNTFPDSEMIMKMLTAYSEQLLLRISQRQMELEPEGIDEIKSLLALSSNLTSAMGFHEYFRFLLKKLLLEGSPSSVGMKQWPTRASLQDQGDVISDIFAMLDDATTWSLYEREMSRDIPPKIKTFELENSKIHIEPKVIRRSRWDLEPDIGLVLPRKIQPLAQGILKHLHDNSPMRSATIHSAAGKMLVSVNIWTFRGKVLTIELTTAQCCVLTLFEENEELKLENVAKAVLLDSTKPSGFDAVVSIVKSMMKEHPIISRLPQNSEFRETDIISLNRQFQPEAEFIRLLEPDYSGEGLQNVKAAGTADVMRCHKMIMEAAVMKLLKQEREMKLSLLEELVRSSHGASAVSFEAAIERLERDEYLTVDGTIARYLD